MDRDSPEVIGEDMRPEYDFSSGVRGKHAREYRRGHTVTIHHRKDGSTVVEPNGPPKDPIVQDPEVER